MPRTQAKRTTHPDTAPSSTGRQADVQGQRALYALQAQFCACLAHPVRLEILDYLTEGELTGTALATALGLPKANVSQHIGILRDAGIITTQRRGVSLTITLALPEVHTACALVRQALAARITAEDERTSRERQLVAGWLAPIALRGPGLEQPAKDSGAVPRTRPATASQRGKANRAQGRDVTTRKAQNSRRRRTAMTGERS